jgi:hypothetical protein
MPRPRSANASVKMPRTLRRSVGIGSLHFQAESEAVRRLDGRGVFGFGSYSLIGGVKQHHAKYDADDGYGQPMA